MSTQVKQQENKEIKSTSLTAAETAEVEQVFAEAKDFRTVGERITAPIDSIISETTKIIEKDPIMDVSDELAKMNGQVQSVYKDIIDNDGALMKTLKSIPLIGSIAKSLDSKMDEAKFNLKDINGKIEVIFSGFDQSYTSINTSIDMQSKFLEGIDANLGKIVTYKEFIDQKIEEFNQRLEASTDEAEKEKLTLFIRNVEYFRSNLIVLIGNLDMARKRLLIRLDSANKLSLAMNSSRPIFKTLLSTAIIETSSQKAIDASMKAMQTMGETIDKMSSTLTDKAIESSKKSEEMTSKSVLSTSVFIENVTKLKNHFDEIETYREQVKMEAEKEKALFDEAKENLRNIKTLNKDDYKELEEEINQK
ncbi:hypothetical protein DLH72_00735 [Candidatus Gracilibacteria bacterium]|nr:MAG: hypothetical protein DLH72_00735 [Candidatus Gracilibacteria bacterium]